jgi:GTP cyclohydrolase II
MKLRLAVLAAALLALLVGAGQAVASDEGGSAQQAAGQAADSGQVAGALSGAQQSKPTNTNISVRVLSPGDGGDVSQSNTVDSNATAGNANLTGQSADQTQSGSCGCEGGTQAIGQSASNDQAAKALSLATQTGASNTNIPVRVLSPGDDGSVEQTNSVDSDATAANLNATGQSADQDQSGAGGTQAIGQAADSEQAAAAASKAEQTGAKNTNISVRVLSPGHDGDVSQANTVDSDATAANLNLTGQKADQDQSGSGGTQAIGQSAKSDQAALAASAAKQVGASNTNVPVRVLSPGHGGDVTQKNSVDSDAKAVNLNATKQDADQDQSGHGCGCSSDGTQAIGQSAKNDQAAIALSAALQSGASNTNTPVRVASKGDDGDVSQKNTVDSDAKAANVNLTGQKADQDQRGGSCKCAGGTQAIGQSADSDQGALAASLAAQVAGHDRCGCGSGGNTNTPVRVDSYGDGGRVDQKNSVESDATAANLNLTGQKADQDQSGAGTQAIGQSAKNDQTAAALSAALQSGASNDNSPVRVHSKGDDGSVHQSNKVDSDAEALNANLTKQDADQDQWGGSCKCAGGTQAIGQSADSDQGALAASLAVQDFGHDKCGCSSGGNSNTPVRIGSYGDGGYVDQSNSVESDATAANLNATKQDADQDQSGAGGIQAIGQSAKNDQAAAAFSAALQSGASNDNSPVRVHSKGDDGSVHQSNKVDSDATALNANLTKQDADQDQWGGRECGCHDGIGIQAIGQEAKNDQTAAALSAALQHGASNSNAPVRVDSKGDGGRVHQSNSVESDATAANLNALHQDADQHQSGGAGIAIQAIGQSAKNDQAALALSAALQFGASNDNSPVRVHSKGDDGSVYQSNKVDSDATALNVNLTEQDAEQKQWGSKHCGCDSIGIQAIGQESKSDQDALAASLAVQAFGHGKCGCSSGGNSNTPVRVGSYGWDGSVHQSNSVESDAMALNANLLGQGARQYQSGGGGLQAIGQSAKNDQSAAALSLALQLAAHNRKPLLMK